MMAQFASMLQKALTSSSDSVTRERTALQQAEQKGIVRMMEPLGRALAEADAIGIQLYGKQLAEYLQVLQAVTPLYATLSPLVQTKPASVLPPSPQPMVPSTPTYVISPATLANAYTLLTRPLLDGGPAPEWMLAVTGVHHDGLRTLEQLLEVKLAHQSSVTAAFDMQDFVRIAVTLYEQGQALHAIFHSHRFTGEPQPSAVDWRLQALLDQGGYPTIQAVFSEDGYVRFFAHRPFMLKVTGKGVHCVDPQTFLYRITPFGTLPHLGNSPQPSGQANGVRPLQPHSRG